jgi:hypothetical protein
MNVWFEKFIKIIKKGKGTHNNCFELAGTMELSVSHQVFVKPKNEQLRTSAISKQHNVTSKRSKQEQIKSMKMTYRIIGLI